MFVFLVLHDRLPAVFAGHVFPLKYCQTLNTVYGINQMGSVKRTKLTMTISHAYSINHKTVSVKVSLISSPSDSYM
jgi:hypothetical protein